MSQEGKPWIGFAIKKAKGRSAILVKDCAEKGPAAAAGLQDGDEIVTIDGKPMPDMPTFRGVASRFSVGQKLRFEFIRGGQKRDTVLTVGVKRREVFNNVPPMNTVRDIETILADRSKMKLVSDAAFAAADDDLSGLVTREEFTSAMKSWMPPSWNITTPDLVAVFDLVDTDKSGFLAGSEFQPLMEEMLRWLVKQNGGSAAPPPIFDSRSQPPPSSQSSVSNGKPYLGFAVSKSKGKPTIFIRDVAEGGPAARAGIIDKDELVTLNGIRMSDMQTFRNTFLNLKVGQIIKLQIARDSGGVDNALKREIEMTVETKRVEEIRDLPPMNTSQDAEAVLRDRKKLEKVSSYIFNMADSDMSGLVTYQEFNSVIRRWLPRDLNGHVSDSDLHLSYKGADSDNSGFLSRSEFIPVVERMLRILIEHARTPQHNVSVPITNAPPVTPVSPNAPAAPSFHNPPPPPQQYHPPPPPPPEPKSKCCCTIS